jgi:glutamate-1-semialdehyde aminotransferase/spore coat polysaccharide biosynthesis protein SpsF (cytidylyltransferase family)
VIVAIVQARLGSTRLPGKTLADISGQPMISWVVRRVERARRVDKVIVATTDDPSDDPLAEFCGSAGFGCFRGSTDDVLDRYVAAAKFMGADTVVRITGDCPLIDPDIIDEVVAAFEATGADYASNVLRATYPEGLDVEVVSLAALERAARTAKNPSDREHVTAYIRNTEEFETASVVSQLSRRVTDIRLSVDEPEDLKLIRAIYERLPGNPVDSSSADVLTILDREPSLLNLNAHIIRDRGYYLSLASDEPIEPSMLELSKSMALMARAARVVPSYTQTFSKNPTQFVRGAAPLYLQSGLGSRVSDVDGNEYIDYILGLGPIILGHRNERVMAAVQEQLGQGSIFSLPHPIEVEVSELLTDLIPSAEMVRFGKNGSDATSGAVRLARAYTGRDVIACCGYHGWQDWFIGSTTRAKGVPQAVRDLTVTFVYNDLASLQRIFNAHPGGVAAVILEPFVSTLPEPGFLEGVRELAQRQGAVLIFDEVITGFRLANGGAQEYFGVTPDLTCLGKAMANGFPLSAIVGKADVMKMLDEVFFSFTFGGEAVSLAAAKATISEFMENDVIGHLWAQGQKLKDGLNVLAETHGLSDYVRCTGLAPRSIVVFEDPTLVLKSLFQQEAAARGVLTSGNHNTCLALTNTDIDHTLRAYNGVLKVIATAIDSGDPSRFLKGPAVEPVFRQM